MSERKLRKRVLELLRPIAAIPVENSAHDGTPDVVCVAGWIELKIASRPGRASSVVAVDLRNSQRIWLRRWRKHGGRAWTLLRLDPDGIWMIHDGAWAADHLGRRSESDLLKSAIAAWDREPEWRQLVDALLTTPTREEQTCAN